MNPAVQSVIVGHKRVAFTSTMTANGNFVVPTDVSSVSLSGKGVDGTSDQNYPTSALSVSVNWNTSGSGAGPTASDWSNAQGVADGNLSAMNAGGSVTIRQITIFEYANGTETLTGSYTTYTNVVAGSASNAYSGDWQSSGAITSSGECDLNFQQFVPGQTGASASGFGKTFPGGSVGTAAPTTIFNSVPVTPGATYSLTIPAGASITITYYR